MKHEGFAVDVSNWTGPLSENTIACFKRNNVKRLICGTQNRAICQQQLGAGYKAGIELQAYVYLYDNAPFDQQVREAVRRLHQPRYFLVTRLWLDCEFATTAPPDVVAERIWLAINTCKALSVPCGIYTGGWWWWGSTRTYEFAHAGIPLWFADYGPINDWPMQYAPSLYAGFGGWTQAEMRQYRGSVSFCNANVDYNWFEEEVMDDKDKRIQFLEEQVEELEGQVTCLKTSLFCYRALMRAIGREDWGAAESVIRIIIKKQKSA